MLEAAIQLENRNSHRFEVEDYEVVYYEPPYTGNFDNPPYQEEWELNFNEMSIYLLYGTKRKLINIKKLSIAHSHAIEGEVYRWFDIDGWKEDRDSL